MELENRKVNVRIIKLIGYTYNVRVEWLTNGNGEMYADKIDVKAKAAMNTFKKLNPAYQDFILKQIELLPEIQNNDNISDNSN